MASIRIEHQFGCVIRRKALDERGIEVQDLLEAMEVGGPLDESEELMAFGPFFGGEAAVTFHERLLALGLVFVDDFTDVVIDLPQWLRLRAEYSGEA